MRIREFYIASVILNQLAFITRPNVVSIGIA